MVYTLLLLLYINIYTYTLSRGGGGHLSWRCLGVIHPLSLIGRCYETLLFCFCVTVYTHTKARFCLRLCFSVAPPHILASSLSPLLVASERLSCYIMGTQIRISGSASRETDIRKHRGPAECSARDRSPE